MTDIEECIRQCEAAGHDERLADGGLYLRAAALLKRVTEQDGRFLRDYFAAAALQTFRQPSTLISNNDAEWNASAAFKIADAMLAERDKP